MEEATLLPQTNITTFCNTEESKISELLFK